MSIFGTKPSPALIHIPSFSSPERPLPVQDQEPSGNDSTTRPPRAQPPLTRAEERQMRFKNANTKWESLGRMMEEQKSNGTSSLLHMMGRQVDIASALGGRQGKVDSGAAKTQKTGSTLAVEDNGQAGRRSRSPTKRKRDAKETEKGNPSRAEIPSEKRTARSRQHRDTEGGIETAALREEVPTRGENRPAAQSTSRPFLSTLTPEGEVGNASRKSKGRIPRAAGGGAKVLDSGPTSPRIARTEKLSSLQIPPSPAQHSMESLPVETIENEAADVVRKEGIESKRRKKPRAAPPTPGPVSRSPSRHRDHPTARVKDALFDIASDEHPIAQLALDSAEQRQSDGADDNRHKKRKMALEKDHIQAEDVSKSKKKPKRAPSLAGKARPPLAEGQGSIAAETTVVSDQQGLTGAGGPPKAKRKREGSGARADEGVGKARQNDAFDSFDTSGSHRPPVQKDTPPTKRSKSRPVNVPRRSPPPSFESGGAPSLLPSPVSETGPAAKGSKAISKQRVVRSERLESTSASQAKVNAFDVLVETAKAAMKKVSEDLSETDSDESTKIATLSGFVANFRLSLLRRSADVSEYAALQRKLTASKATVKSLQAAVETAKQSQ